MNEEQSGWVGNNFLVAGERLGGTRPVGVSGRSYSAAWRGTPIERPGRRDDLFDTEFEARAATEAAALADYKALGEALGIR